MLSLKPYSLISPFRFWSQKVLPLVYDDSLSYYELLCKVVDYLNDVIADLGVAEENIDTVNNALQELNEYVRNLDIDDAVTRRLDEMVEDGTLDAIIGNLIGANETNFKHDLFVIIGDSYAIPSATRGNWIEPLANYMNLRIARTAEEVAANTNCIDLSRGGRGFCSGAENIRWLENLQQRWPENVDKKKVTKMFIAGGYNDRTYSYEEIRAAIAEFYEYVRIKFPNAEVYVSMVGASIDTADMPGLSTVYQAYKMCSIYKNWVYCSGLEGVLHRRDYLLADNHHPTQTGCNDLAQKIKEFFYNGKCSPIYSNAYFTLASGVTSGATIPTCQSGCLEGIYSFFDIPTLGRLTFETPQNAAYGNNILIGTLSNCYVSNSNEGTNTGTAYPFTTSGVAIDESNNRTVLVFGIWVRNNGEILLRVMNSPAGTNPIKMLDIGGLHYMRSIYAR